MSSTDPLAQAQANPASAEKTYNQILAEDSSTADAQLLRDKETALIKLGKLYQNQKNVKELAEVIALSCSFMSSITKVCQKSYTPLTSLETCLVSLQLESQQLQLTLMLIDNLLTELKHLDDKMILTEVYLFESRNTYGAAIDILKQAGKVVQSLYAKVCYCFVLLRLVGC
ncbi:putative 26S proteasome regulatory subunit rpn6 [Leucoagaricus sp. SymC.cos]|nr:putative 26S proteasome regulatory subunit rpn6 [Leucoagaricus sp. SymC.cos]